jgi:small subunit ribosomal protein S17
LSENAKNEEQIEETPATPESSEETQVEAEAPAEDPAVEEPEAVEVPAAEEPAAEEPAAEEPAAEEPVAEEAPAAEAPEEAVEEPAAQEPVAEEPAAEEAAPEEAAPEEKPVVVQPEPKKKRKRLPRPLRRQKTRPRRPAPTGERKPIVRAPKPEHERGRRQERRGVVVSSAMDKTIVVKVELITSHQRYKKVIRRSVKFHAHDEQNTAKVGDVVRIVETRPLSATKRWRLAEVVEAAK